MLTAPCGVTPGCGCKGTTNTVRRSQSHKYNEIKFSRVGLSMQFKAVRYAKEITWIR